MKFEDSTAIMDIRHLGALAGKSDEERRSACFIVLTGSQAGKMYKIEQNHLSIGRAVDAAIRIDDDGVSRRHAELDSAPNGDVTLADLGSTNGTFCNGDKISSRILQDGDKIQIGTTTILKFSYQDSVEEEFQLRQYESATRDALTGCYNKKFFLERLPGEFAHAMRHNQPLALAMFDIDFFKKVNDNFGHQAGDHALRRVAKNVEDTIRTEDILSRYGGEEFALIMRETPLESAFIVAERIRRSVENGPHDYEGQVIPVTISIGLAICVNKQPKTPDELIKIADSYLYRAKEGGRNRTECELISG